MNSYSNTVRLKLGLIAAAMVIAMASLWYTNRIANRIQNRELDYLRLWTSALQYQYESQIQAINPHLETFVELEGLVNEIASDPARAQAYARALRWARSMPPPGETVFVSNEIVIPNRFQVPTVVTDTLDRQIVSFRNIGIDTLQTLQDTMRVQELVKGLDQDYDPLQIRLQIGPYRLAQVVHYGESDLVRQLRLFPFIQLFFVGLFVFVGYMGFSYVRRAEQSNLWVGMAKEAAHQLGTPISSMLGWIEMLRMGKSGERIADELDRDVQRLLRVANRFSKIGSKPVLERVQLGPVIDGVSEYMTRRLPSAGNVELTTHVPDELTVPLNVELFEWVIENLTKNALDAVDVDAGRIEIHAGQMDRHVVIDVSDNGKGIEYRNWKNVFRPGYSTKKRGWGLGLTLAKRIVEDYHGGSLRLASSRAGEGTTFRITLPLGD